MFSAGFKLKEFKKIQLGSIFWTSISNLISTSKLEYSNPLKYVILYWLHFRGAVFLYSSDNKGTADKMVQIKQLYC